MNKKKIYLTPVTELVRVCGNAGLMDDGHYTSAFGKNLDGSNDYEHTGGLTGDDSDTPTDDDGVPILGAKHHAWSDWKSE